MCLVGLIEVRSDGFTAEFASTDLRVPLAILYYIILRSISVQGMVVRRIAFVHPLLRQKRSFLLSPPPFLHSSGGGH